MFIYGIYSNQIIEMSLEKAPKMEEKEKENRPSLQSDVTEGSVVLVKQKKGIYYSLLVN